MNSFDWSGGHMNGSRPCAVVKYHGPTNSKCSRWIATIRRDPGDVWRASVPFLDGPVMAALKATGKAGVPWKAITCHSIDSDTYCIGF